MSRMMEAASPLDDALRAFAGAAADAVAAKYSVAAPAVTFEAPRRPEFGDFATNVAFALAKTARRKKSRPASSLRFPGERPSSNAVSAASTR
jgi:arginyl-tRNA synthetase